MSGKREETRKTVYSRRRRGVEKGHVDILLSLLLTIAPFLPPSFVPQMLASNDVYRVFLYSLSLFLSFLLLSFSQPPLIRIEADTRAPSLG